MYNFYKSDLYYVKSNHYSSDRRVKTMNTNISPGGKWHGI